MEIVKVSEILDLVKRIHKDSQTAIHYLEGRILIGEINRPEMPQEKKPRKKRARKQKVQDFPPLASLQLPKDLLDADKGKAGEFFKKKKEKKIDGGE